MAKRSRSTGGIVFVIPYLRAGLRDHVLIYSNTSSISIRVSKVFVMNSIDTKANDIIVYKPYWFS